MLELHRLMAEFVDLPRRHQVASFLEGPNGDEVGKVELLYIVESPEKKG